MLIQPVILCGGSGTRLWPASREQYPKQLLALSGEHTMLQETALRLAAELSGIEVAAPVVVANEEYRFIVAEQLREAGQAAQAVILEPVGRNTAPALTLAALAAGGDPVLVAMPADHVMTDQAAFRDAVARAAALAEAGMLVTFGITPAAPETGYGYIRRGRPIGEPAASAAFELERFVEKPDAGRAREYLASGEYLWNSGIFVMKASAWLAQIERLRPDIALACRKAYSGAQRDRDFLRVDREAFAACPSDSIDYAVMERICAGDGGKRLAAVVPLSAGWSDVGAWDALWSVSGKDAEGNVVRGDVLLHETHGTLAISGSRLVACIGLKDAVVIETPDAVMVAARDRAQDVKRIVARLKEAGRDEVAAHRKIHRPWGYYDSIDRGERFQVKRIVVAPGATLSLQMHHHRAEHWVVVRGTARVTRGESVFLLGENESTYIPLGVKHRLENPGKLPLEIVEVQSGAYLGEDDIVRFEDSYGRG
ncbi:MAG: mannose-1-phosphate guanylyltransferase/mannose-6-phosphate isomerase [Rhodocyclaceae bacterium]